MTVTDDSQVISSPTVRNVVRRALFWIALVTIILILALVGLGATRSTAAQDTLAPDDPSPKGAKALVEVLRQQGVTVAITDSLRSTESAISNPDETTLVIHDSAGLLDNDQIVEAAALSTNVVLIAPDFLELNAVANGIALAGDVSGTAKADCPIAAVVKAGKVTATGQGYRLLGDTTTGTACLSTRSKVYSLVQVENSLGTITAIGTTDALSNDQIGGFGNAALALNLLGPKTHLVWYTPSAKDLSSQPLPTIAELSPGWVIQVTGLLFITIVAAGFWRGRRMGPLIVENLPVTVRASETMHGRARLYENSNSRLHALDSLRIGTITRLAVSCGLPTAATVDDVSRAVASVTHRDPTSVYLLLVGARPSTDRQLIDLSDDLLRLERDVAESIRPR